MSEPTYADFVRKLFNRTGDLSKDFSHAVLGLVTELFEFEQAIDETNAIEELGDIGFFHTALEIVAEDYHESIGLPYAKFEPAHNRIMDLTALAEKKYPNDLARGLCNEMLDHAKRWVGYGKAPADWDEIFYLYLLAGSYALSNSRYSDVIDKYDRKTVLAANVRKLLKRYPGGEFDAFRAIARDLDAERNAVLNH